MNQRDQQAIYLAALAQLKAEQDAQRLERMIRQIEEVADLQQRAA